MMAGLLIGLMGLLMDWWYYWLLHGVIEGIGGINDG